MRLRHNDGLYGKYVAFSYIINLLTAVLNIASNPHIFDGLWCAFTHTHRQTDTHIRTHLYFFNR